MYRSVCVSSYLPMCLSGLVIKVSASGADLGSNPASAVGLLPGRVIQGCKKSRIAPFNAIMMMMMMMMMMMIINRIGRRNSRFFTIPSLRRELSPTRTLQCGPSAIVCKSCATHPALITCNMQCATWCDGTARRLSLTELKSQFFRFIFIG